MSNTNSFLFDLWYLATPSHTLKSGCMLAKTMLGQPLLLGRSSEGKVFALRNICPHRAVPLSHGCFDGKEIECCYHGWRFNTSGTCTAIPSLSSNQKLNLDKIRVFSFPCKEIQGNIWVYIPSQTFSLENLPEIPVISLIPQQQPNFVDHIVFPCHIDHAIVGLMDPAHGAFVHRSWWWRSKKSLHEKHKEFIPIDYGFRMQKHLPSKNSKGYKFLLGKKISTEISFYLPGIRIEHITVGSKNVYALTTTTPLTETTTEIHQFFYWDLPWLTMMKPFLAPLARKFLRQDYKIVQKQQMGLMHQKELMLIHDADTQARWYYQLKKEYLAAQVEQRKFVNPVPETVLTWCS